MFKYIFHILAVCLLCVSFVACGNTDDMPVQEEDKGPVEVSMTLVVDRSMESRANYSYLETDDGNTYENYIDIENKDIRFYLFDGNKKFLSEIEVKSITPMNGERTEYFVRAKIAEKPTGTFKIMILANMNANRGTYPTFATGQEVDMEDFVEASEFIYTDEFNLSEGSRIPMYGVHTYTNVEFGVNMEPLLEQITLLRAMAKIEVSCSTATGYELISTTMTNYSVRGMSAPKNLYDDTMDILNDEKETVTWENIMHIDHGDRINTGIIDFSESKNIYVPEYSNTGDLPCYLTVKLQNISTGEEKEYPIEFKIYKDGKPTESVMDIWRNNYYKFVITGVGAGIEVTINVADWVHEEEKHRWEHNFQYPSFEQVLPSGYNNVTDGKIPEEKVRMYYNPAIWDSETKKLTSYFLQPDVDIPGAFDVVFKMHSPEGLKWLPIIDAQESKYMIKVTRLDSGDPVDLTDNEQWTSSPNPYRIQIIPREDLPQDKDNQEIRFGISTTLSYLEQAVLLTINPKPDIWPGEHTETDYIYIKEIHQPTSPSS